MLEKWRKKDMSQITLNFDKKAAENVSFLKIYYGIASTPELVRRALTLMRIVSRFQKEGGRLILKDKDNKEHIVNLT